MRRVTAPVPGPTSSTRSGTPRRPTCRANADASRRPLGKIAPGYKADLAIFDMSAPHWCPQHDLASMLAYAANAADVSHTLVDGRVLYRKGEFTTLDIEKVKAEAGARGLRLVK